MHCQVGSWGKKTSPFLGYNILTHLLWRLSQVTWVQITRANKLSKGKRRTLIPGDDMVSMVSLGNVSHPLSGAGVEVVGDLGY